ncbi:MAG: hypothetical protein ACOC03_03840 [Desulfosalsimonas sp.]
MRIRRGKIIFLIAVLGAFCLCVQGCEKSGTNSTALDVPRGYVSEVQVEDGDRLLHFGPFVGYYFKPETPGDFTRLEFVCFNERSFYTKDVPENAKLYEGTAVLTHLPSADFEIPESSRINPVYFSEAPAGWLETRPEPKDAFVHFHSCYDAQGAVLAGYWIKHDAVAEFTYDMGGRVDPDSSLYHKVTPGTDRDFARIIEFDYGPD